MKHDVTATTATNVSQGGSKRHIFYTSAAQLKLCIFVSEGSKRLKGIFSNTNPSYSPDVCRKHARDVLFFLGLRSAAFTHKVFWNIASHIWPLRLLRPSLLLSERKCGGEMDVETRCQGSKDPRQLMLNLGI